MTDFLVRIVHHGCVEETVGDGVWHLTADGREKSTRIGEEWKNFAFTPSVIFSSPASCARETALSVCGTNVHLIEIPELGFEEDPEWMSLAEACELLNPDMSLAKYIHARGLLPILHWAQIARSGVLKRFRLRNFGSHEHVSVAIFTHPIFAQMLAAAFVTGTEYPSEEGLDESITIKASKDHDWCTVFLEK